MKSASQTLTALTSLTCVTVSAGQRLTTKSRWGKTAWRTLNSLESLFLAVAENKQCGLYKAQRDAMFYLIRKLNSKKVLKAMTHAWLTETLRKFSHEEVKKAHSHVWALNWKSLSILVDGCRLISQIKDAPVTLRTILNITELIYLLMRTDSLPQHGAKITQDWVEHKVVFANLATLQCLYFQFIRPLW